MKYFVNGDAMDKDAAIEAILEEVETDQYDEFLDEAYGEVEIAGMTFSTSYALKELDPTAYRCGFNDYTDGLRDEVGDLLDGLDYGDEDEFFGVSVTAEDDKEEETEEEEEAEEEE